MSKARLKEGDVAPQFEAKNQNGELVNLKDFHDQKLVLFFFDGENKKVTKEEVANLRDHYKDLELMNYFVLGVGNESVASLQALHEELNPPFDLLSDPDHQIMLKYDVWGEERSSHKERTYHGVHPTTFLIERDGTISLVIRDVNNARAYQQIDELTSKHRS